MNAEKTPKQSLNLEPETLQLFKEGFSIEEIARVRMLPIAEVENYIAHFVLTGELNVLMVLPKVKLVEVLKAYHKHGNSNLPALRKILGEEYNFLEIRSAINYWIRANKDKIEDAKAKG